jgi:hypothetical protein
MLNFQQGESRILNIPILEGGQSVIMTSALEIRCVLKVRLATGYTDVAKYSLNPATNYGELTVNANSTSIDVQVTHQQSRAFPVGVLWASVTAQFPDLSFASGVRQEKYDYMVGRVFPGNDLNEIP